MSDEQRRRLAKFARLSGILKMADFFVTPPRSSINYIFVVVPRNRLIFKLLKLILISISHSYMKYMLRGTNISLSESIETLVEAKIKALERFISRLGSTVEARIEVGKPSKHHHTGLVFYAEINLKVAGQLLRAEATHLELSYAINEAFKEIERQIKDYKDKTIEKSRNIK